MVQIHVSYLSYNILIYVTTLQALLWILMVILDALLVVRVCVIMWCLPECFSISRSETWGDLSMCHLSRGANCGHSQVPYLHAHPCIPSLSSSKWKKTQLQIAWFSDDDILSFFTYFVCSCRPGVRGAPLPARAILSMGGLSHGVIRVNTEDKNSALTVQDVGHIMPGGQLMQHLHITVHACTFPWKQVDKWQLWLVCVLALMCIVKPEGPPQLCKTDEIGEIVINSRAGGTLYYGLPGVTKNTFEVCHS